MKKVFSLSGQKSRSGLSIQLKVYNTVVSKF